MHTQRGRLWFSQVEQLLSPDDIAQAKVVDDLAFGVHQGISIEELERIRDQGGLLGIRNEKGQVIGHIQIIFEPIGSQPAHLAPDEAYCCGIAVHPSFQGQGIGMALALAQEQLAVEHGKKWLSLSVRPENRPALALWFKQGFRIYDYDPHYYGDNEDKDGRLLMKKDLTEPRIEIASLPENIPELHTVAEVQKAIKQGEPVFALRIRSVDALDRDARALIKLAINQGYYGILCLESITFW